MDGVRVILLHLCEQQEKLQHFSEIALSLACQGLPFSLTFFSLIHSTRLSTVHDLRGLLLYISVTRGLSQNSLQQPFNEARSKVDVVSLVARLEARHLPVCRGAGQEAVH